MNTPVKHLVLAVLLVVLAVVSGPLIPHSKVTEVSILGVGEALGTFPTDPQLSLTIPKQSSELAISSQSEVLFFDLDSEAVYTLRYMTLAVDSEGLVLPSKLSEWKVFHVEDGLVNYKEAVGYAEQMNGGLLRLRLYSNPAAGYSGEGAESFALVAPLYKTGEETASLRLTFPKFLPEEFGWEFIAGQHSEPWMDLSSDEILKTEQLKGLPSESVLRE